MTQPQNPFNAPAPVGGVRPRVADLVGRMVAFIPQRLDLNVPGIKPGTTQDRITADLIVFDGPELVYGGNPAKGKPHTLVTAIPTEFTGMYVSQVNLVNSMRGVIGSGVVLGRIQVGITNTPGNNPPYNLVEVDPADPMYRFAIDYWSARALGGITLPEPRPIPGAPAPTMAHTHATTMPHNPAGQPVPNPAVVGAAASAYGPPAHVAPVQPAQDPGYAAWLASQAQAAQAAAQPAAPVLERSPVPTITDQVWTSLNAAQRQAILATPAPAASDAPPY